MEYPVERLSREPVLPVTVVVVRGFVIDHEIMDCLPCGPHVVLDVPLRHVPEESAHQLVVLCEAVVTVLTLSLENRYAELGFFEEPVQGGIVPLNTGIGKFFPIFNLQIWERHVLLWQTILIKHGCFDLRYAGSGELLDFLWTCTLGAQQAKGETLIERFGNAAVGGSDW